MKEGYFAKRGIAYRATEIQSHRPTLLLLHGLSGSNSAWFSYEKELEKDFNLIAPDLRGHGLSKRWNTPQAYAFPEFANDIVALLAFLNLKEVTIVAHSFAAVIVRELAKQRQISITHIVLLAPAYGVHRLLLTRLAIPILVFLSQVVRFIKVPVRSERVDYRSFVGYGDWNIRRIRADVSTTGIHAYLWSLLALYRYPSDPWRELADARILIVHGRADRFVPFSHSVELARILSKSHLILLEQTNHMLVLNNVREITTLIRSFMTEHHSSPQARRERHQ